MTTTLNQATVLTITEANLDALVTTQNEILKLLKSRPNPTSNPPLSSHITAREFMDAVRIKRTKFDQLVAEGKIRIVKKKRKIYVPAGEVERFFKDPGII